MSLFSFRDSVDALDDLLNRERQAVLKGDFYILARMLKEKERLLALVGTTEPTHRLQHLRDKADRNQAMLLAASKGIRMVSERLTRRADTLNSFQTYDRSGQRHRQTTSSSKLERRA